MKKAIKITGITLLSIITFLLIGLIALALNSPGVLEPLRGIEEKEIIGSLSEKNFTEIGGMQQGFLFVLKIPRIRLSCSCTVDPVVPSCQ